MSNYDAIIVGAGHNGLVCATLLAKAGKRVLVLEANASEGGLGASREFHEGFQAPMAHGAASFSSTVLKDLNLAGEGLSFSDALPTVGLSEDGKHVSVVGDSVTGALEADAAAYPAYRAKLKRYAKVLKSIWESTLPRLGAGGLAESLVYAKGALNVRMLGRDDMGEFVRVLTLPMRDLIDEVFEDPKLQGLLSWDGVIGNKMAPRSPNNAVLPLLLRMNGLHDGDHCVPTGGMKALNEALLSAAKKAGVTIRFDAPVANFIIEGDENGQRATGVALASGETLQSSTVVSSADPKTTFMKLVGARHLDIQFTNRINRLRADGMVAKYHAALSELPKINGLDELGGRLLIAPTFDAIEFAYDDAKYGEASEHPVMEITFPSLQDPSLAPDGKHVMSVNVMYAPYKEKSGWSEAARSAFLGRVVETLEKYIPGISSLVMKQELLTPADLEAEYHAYGGHWHHGELSLEQALMMRPTYYAAQYSTPIPGIYLCGAGAHPGGGMTGLPGRNAAREILK